MTDPVSVGGRALERMLEVRRLVDALDDCHHGAGGTFVPCEACQNRMAGIRKAAGDALDALTPHDSAVPVPPEPLEDVGEAHSVDVGGLLERVRDALASLPLDALGEGQHVVTAPDGQAGVQTWPIRDELISNITTALSRLASKPERLDPTTEELALARNGRKIEGVKRYRNRTGTTLRIAKDAIDSALASGQTPVTREPDDVRELKDAGLLREDWAQAPSEPSEPEWSDAVAIVQRAHANGAIEAYELRGPKGFWSASGDTEGSERTGRAGGPEYALLNRLDNVAGVLYPRDGYDRAAEVVRQWMKDYGVSEPSVREADSERLDWLEATAMAVVVDRTVSRTPAPTIPATREAIDNARLASTPTRETADTEADDG